MEVVEQHVAVVRRLAVDLSCLTGSQRVDLVRDLQAARNWLDGREAELLSEIHHERDDIDAGARDVAQLSQHQANVGYGEAKRRALRATWTTELPPLRDALLSGRLGTPVVDEVCLLAERLDGPERRELAAAIGGLITELTPLTPARARKHLREFEASLQPDDGKKRLEKQKQKNTLRVPKRPDGTFGISGRLDPVSGEYLKNAIDAKVTEMWRLEGKGRHDMSPPDRVLTNDQRRAAALVSLVRAGAAADPATRGKAEIIVLIDHRTLLGQLSGWPVAKLGSGEPIPAATARRLACDAGILPVVLGGPSQPLDVGRRARLATPAQRAALRAIHETCCVKGCDVPFDHCDIHHITWWRHGGGSDLANLAPVCSKHHHLIHDDDWDLVLDADRVGHLRHRSDPPPAPVPLQTRSHDRRFRSTPDAARHRPTSTEHRRPMRC